MVCKDVETEVNKCLIKQERVQHLYARFNGELADEAAEVNFVSLESKFVQITVLLTASSFFASLYCPV